MFCDFVLKWPTNTMANRESPVIITFIIMIVFCPPFLFNSLRKEDSSNEEQRKKRKKNNRKKGKRNGKTKYVVFLCVFFEFSFYGYTSAQHRIRI